MSADRYEISEGELDVLAITGPEGTRYIDGEEIEARVIRQLRSDLAAVTAERDRLKLHATDLTECALKTIPADWRPGYAWTDDGVMNVLAEYVGEIQSERDQLRAQLAEYVEAPVVAVVRADYNDTDAWNFIDCDNMPEAGTELIARPKVRK